MIESQQLNEFNVSNRSLIRLGNRSFTNQELFFVDVLSSIVGFTLGDKEPCPKSTRILLNSNDANSLIAYTQHVDSVESRRRVDLVHKIWLTDQRLFQLNHLSIS